MRGFEPHRLTRVARELRRDMTPAERALWRAVRNGRLFGAKARRQMLFGRYVLDFAFAEAKLSIEIDGDTHATDEQRVRNAARDAFLIDWGWRLLRFSNREVLDNLGGVLAVIAEALQAPHPGPLPKGEGEEQRPLQ